MQDVVKTTPFNIDHVYALKDDNQYLKMYLITQEVAEDIKLLSVFYKQKSAVLKQHADTGIYIADFSFNNRDKTVSINPADESNNTVPNISSKPPFKVSSDKAILKFSQSGKNWFYIIKNIEVNPTNEFMIEL